MSKIKATTYVICPIGTPIEVYTSIRPSIGEIFKIRHIDTKKVVQEAKVTGMDDLSYKNQKSAKYYRVRAVIIKSVGK